MSTSFKPGECLMLVNQLEDPASGKWLIANITISQASTTKLSI